MNRSTGIESEKTAGFSDTVKYVGGRLVRGKMPYKGRIRRFFQGGSLNLDRSILAKKLREARRAGNSKAAKLRAENIKNMMDTARNSSDKVKAKTLEIARRKNPRVRSPQVERYRDSLEAHRKIRKTTRNHNMSFAKATASVQGLVLAPYATGANLGIAHAKSSVKKAGLRKRLVKFTKFLTRPIRDAAAAEIRNNRMISRIYDPHKLHRAGDRLNIARISKAVKYTKEPAKVLGGMAAIGTGGYGLGRIAGYIEADKRAKK